MCVCVCVFAYCSSFCRRESFKRNYYIISPRVIIKAIIITRIQESACVGERESKRRRDRQTERKLFDTYQSVLHTETLCLFRLSFVHLKTADSQHHSLPKMHACMCVCVCVLCIFLSLSLSLSLALFLSILFLTLSP